MWNFIEGFRKIQQYQVRLSRFVELRSKIMGCEYELRFTRPTFAKTVLSI